MSEINVKAVYTLEENADVEVYAAGVNILLKLLENVIREPYNLKYRKIRFENKIIKEKLLSLPGALELLHSIGFEQVENDLVLSMNVLIATIKNYRDLLRKRLEAATTPCAIPSTSGLQKQPPAPKIVKKKVCQRPQICSKYTYLERITFPTVIPFQNNFLMHLEQTSDQVQQYEDEELKSGGLQLIPLERLTENVIKNMRHLQKQISTKAITEDEPCFRDWLLVELTRWFKEEFFTWVNSLPCVVCGVEKDRPRYTFIDDDVRVEAFKCCETTTKFYRFNDVVKLLQTRKGRCGEFANCFTFLCRCLGYEARLVYATFDHVWTEVYSVKRKQWIHIDPSDNLIDAPLTYEHGWKRNIDYITAFSHDDIQDVTWRYSSKHDEVATSREQNTKQITEESLLQAIELLRGKRQEHSTDVRKKYLVKRALMELVELMVEKDPTENETKGRTSGSLSWRLQRGEQNKSNNFYVFAAHPLEVSNKEFNLRYSCSLNKYERFANDGTVIEQSTTWESCTFGWENIYRKVERDWKMVYLSRAEGTDTAEIQWKFNFSERNLKIKNICLKFDTKLYENGEVDLQFISRGKIVKSIQELNGTNEFSIKALLKGGRGDCAWQHTQLFRQNIDDKEFPFILKIKFD